MKIKYTFNILLLLLLPFWVFAQPASSVDFGFGLGLSSYYGDINQEQPFYNPKVAKEGFVRYNFNDRFALRANILSTKLEGNDIDFKNSYQQKRGEFFSKGILELALQGEVNFFSYLNPTDWDSEQSTIYATLGGGIAMNFQNKKEGGSIPILIMGVGYKRVLGNRMAIEVEWAFRKCLNDELDDIVDPTNSKVSSRFFNNDWYNTLSVKLSFNLFNFSNVCRTFEKDSDL